MREYSALVSCELLIVRLLQIMDGLHLLSLGDELPAATISLSLRWGKNVKQTIQTRTGSDKFPPFPGTIIVLGLVWAGGGTQVMYLINMFIFIVHLYSRSLHLLLQPPLLGSPDQLL